MSGVHEGNDGALVLPSGGSTTARVGALHFDTEDVDARAIALQRPRRGRERERGLLPRGELRRQRGDGRGQRDVVGPVRCCVGRCEGVGQGGPVSEGSTRDPQPHRRVGQGGGTGVHDATGHGDRAVVGRQDRRQGVDDDVDGGRCRVCRRQWRDGHRDPGGDEGGETAH